MPNAPTDRPTRPRPRRRRLVVGLAALLALPALVGPTAGAAGTQDPSAADARARRDEIRRQQTELAEQLEPLKATDAELAKALATLDANVSAQQARASDASRAADDARHQVETLTAQRQQTEREIDGLERRVRDRAVSSYVNPAGRVDEPSLVLQGDDLSSAERKRALVEAVTGSGQDARDQLRLAKDGLQRLQAAAQAASQEADQKEAEAKDALAELEKAEAAQRKIKAAYEARIKGYEDEATTLAAEDAQMQKIITDAEARAAAQAEADRKAQQVLAGRSAEGNGGGGSTPAPDAPGSVARPARSGGCIWPIDGQVSQEYGGRGGHPGIDIFAPMGTPIYAAMSGTVIFAGWNNGGYGNLVLIDHGNDTVTAYAHQSEIVATVGQQVSQGQLIGHEGSTGHSTGPHLHFEVRVGGQTTNPRSCLP
ncbi:MAG: peptidoglycan DD-metalloendopeptidase family protein [Acidimicrobiales bacterium]